MERPIKMSYFHKTIAVGYVFITVIICSIVYFWFNEWHELETLEAENQQINRFRQEIHNTYVQITELSLLGETVLEWDKSKIKQYRLQRLMADSLLCRFKKKYPSERLDSVCLLLADKEHLMLGIVVAFDQQETMNEEIARQLPVIVQQSVQENTGKKKQGGFLGLFKKKNKHTTTTAITTAMLQSLNRHVLSRNQEQRRLLSEYADSLAIRNSQLNTQLQRLIRQMDARVQNDLHKREQEITSLREHSFIQIGGLTGFVILLLIGSYVIIYSDTKRKAAYRRKLEASDREKDKLLAARKQMLLTVSHDLRAPLAAINGYAELLPDEQRKKNRLHYSEAIRQSSERMLSLLNSLLHYYRLDTGKEQPECSPFRLRNLVDTLAAEYALTVAKKQLELITEYDGDDVIVTGDRRRILQVISNLLSNAVKFTSVGYVRLGLYYADGFVTIRVEDTGSGMTKEQSARIYEPFTRLENAETEEGFGLGLSITLALVELLDGEITVSSHPGTGSAFTVRLPLCVCTEDGLLSQDTPPINLPVHLRVVVVDNDAVLLAMIMEMFARHKVHAESCHNVKELMERLRMHDYDLVITDIMMPGVNGFGLLELLRTSNIGKAKTVPVVAMTARAERSANEFISAGFAGCLYKPFSRDELFAAISGCIGKQVKEVIPEADFSVLLSGENNGKEMLDLLVRETENNMAALSEGLEKGDRKTIATLTHQLLPFWEVLRIDAPLRDLRQTLSAADTTNETLHTIIQTVLAVGGRLLVKAKEQEGRL